MLAFMAVSAFASAQQAPAIYGIKSGIVTTESEMMGQPMTQIMYFDDFGRKQATVSDFGGMKIRMINVDGAQVMVNEEQGTALRMGGGPGFGGRTQINFMNLTDEVVKANKIKEVGEDKIAGKTCKRYSITIDMMGESMEQVLSIYQGITMKSVMESPMGTMEQVVSKLEENPTIPASMFTVPEGIEVQDFDPSMMGGGF